VDDGLSRTPPGVAPVVLLLFASAASASASLHESALIWALVAVAFGVIIVHEFRAGYESNGATEQAE